MNQPIELTCSGCPSGKITYETRPDASKAARHHRGNVEPYKCSLCDRWHLASVKKGMGRR